jgi:hypothetical protein
MREKRHSPLYCSFDSPCIVCRMFSFSVMGITTVLYRACYIPHGGSTPLKMHCALRSVSFSSHISLHTHTHTKLVIPVCLHKVREFCCQAHNNAATGTQTGSLLQFQLNCYTMNAKCLRQKRRNFIYILCKGAVRGSDYKAPNAPKISRYNQLLF